MSTDAFFPSIGDRAQQTDERPVEENQEEDQQSLQEVESLCMSCGEQGTTRMLLTSIPYFREVILMSFRCEHCGDTNNEIQSAGVIREQGTIYTTKVITRTDLDRQLVKSSTCTIFIPEFELTLPPGRGQLTTVEGLIRDIARDLAADQPLRKFQDEPVFLKIQSVVDQLQTVLADSDDEEGIPQSDAPKPPKPEDISPPFTLKLDDPAGNSFIEFRESMADPKWNLRTYERTRQQNIEIGVLAPEDEEQDTVLPEEREGLPNEEIYTFPGVCPSCSTPLDTMMKKVSIPYFKDMLIMSTNCDQCGYRDNEVKSGAAISKKGRRMTLKVEDREDLSRDILKSETCKLEIPEIDLVLQAGTLGGRFTTVEGILEQVYEELSQKVFTSGDASEDAGIFENFLRNLKEIKAVERPFTLILEDPLANSYLQNLYAPDPDPAMTVEVFERTWEQNEDLGLNDMKVEGYESDDTARAMMQ